MLRAAVLVLVSERRLGLGSAVGRRQVGALRGVVVVVVVAVVVVMVMMMVVGLLLHGGRLAGPEPEPGPGLGARSVWGRAAPALGGG